MGRKQDQAVSNKATKLGVAKQVDQGQIRKQQHGKAKGIETIKRAPLRSKAGFTLYSQCSDSVKPTILSIPKPVAINQKEKEAEDQFMQQTDVVSQMQIQNELMQSEKILGIMIPTADMESSADSACYGNFDFPEFGTPFNKRLVSSTPDPESLLEAELLEHSMMCPQVIPERDTNHRSQATDLMAPASLSLSEKLKIQRQKIQQNQQKQENQQLLQQKQNTQQLLQQKQSQEPHIQWQQQMFLSSSGGISKSQLLFGQSSELLKDISVPDKKDVGNSENVKISPLIPLSVDNVASFQPNHATQHARSQPYQSLRTVLPEASVNSILDGDVVSINTNETQLGIPVLKVTSSHLPETSHPDKACLSHRTLTNDNINKCSSVQVSPLKYKTLTNKVIKHPSSGFKFCEVEKETCIQGESASAFCKTEDHAGTQNCVTSSYLVPSAGREIKLPESNNATTVHNIVDPQVSQLSNYEETAQTNVTRGPEKKSDLKSLLMKESNNNNPAYIASGPHYIRHSKGHTVSKKSKAHAVKEIINVPSKSSVQMNAKSLLVKENVNTKSLDQYDNLNKGHKSLPKKSQVLAEKVEDSQLRRNLHKDNLNTSSDTCDMEVKNVLNNYESNTGDNNKEGSIGANKKVDDESDIGRISVASVSSNLSQVIEFLKTNAFNQAKECMGERCSVVEHSVTKAAGIAAINSNPDNKQSCDNETLAELMRQYLPETILNSESNNDNEHADSRISKRDGNREDGSVYGKGDQCTGANVSLNDKESESKNRNGIGCGKDVKRIDLNGSGCDKDAGGKETNRSVYDKDPKSKGLDGSSKDKVAKNKDINGSVNDQVAENKDVNVSHIEKDAKNKVLNGKISDKVAKNKVVNCSDNDNVIKNKVIHGNSNNKDAKCKDAEGIGINRGNYNEDSKSKDSSSASSTLEEAELNINQNRFCDEDSDCEVPASERQKNLYYLERMSDPGLRDVACRLTLKATALRDVELRDLIDEMIFLTDAALGREDARFQSAEMFFAEENSKLKKRIQTVNQQLDAKERQERLGTLGHSDNDVLHLERKLIYLRDEKEKLDNQVTTLLEEKAKWLITQQDLVRTISFKDHELLKIEEKHHEEKKSLLQSLDQATQNSQGVHYKLSVADKEISNLEERIKSRNLEIMSLKDQLKDMESRLEECHRHSTLKSQEILHLQDLVDALKIGVGHVLQAYESSFNKDTTAEQRQGMENLRQMVHPEEYRRVTAHPGVKADKRNIQIRDPQDIQQTFTSSQSSSLSNGNKIERPYVRQKYHPDLVRDRLHHGYSSVRDSIHGAEYYRQHTSRDVRQGNLPQQLTSKNLQEHNKRLSPINNKFLWRNLDESKIQPFMDQEPYYSDSEIEVNGPSRRRSSWRRYGTTTGHLHRQPFMPYSSLHHSQSQRRTEMYPKVHTHDNEEELISRSPGTTVVSETEPKYRHTNPLSDETYYSTLRSESLPDKLYMPERKPAKESYHPRSLSLSHPSPRQKHIMNRRNGKLHSLRHEYEQVPENYVTVNSWHLNDQDADLITLQPAHQSDDRHEISQEDMETFPKSVHKERRNNRPHYVPNPLTSLAQSNKEKETLQSKNQSGENDRLTHYLSQTHSHDGHSGRHETSQLNDSLGHSSFIRQSIPSDAAKSLPDDSISLSDISVSRRATRGSDSVTQRAFFQGTELSASLSTISDFDIPSSNNNQLTCISEDPFSSGIASLDEKIANLQRKIDRTKAKYS